MFYINEIPILSQYYKKGSMSFFTVTLWPFIKYDSSPLFSVAQHHQKRWDPPTPYTWRNHSKAPFALHDNLVEQLGLLIRL